MTHFWSHFSILSILNKFKKIPFTPQIFERPVLEKLPHTHLKIITCVNSTEEILTEITTFLKTHFGKPPHTPILNIPITKILEDHDTILCIYHDIEGLIACIRYHYIGQFIFKTQYEDIYNEDCFCIHPKWRRKGIGTYILTELHHYANLHNKPFSIFLKEGNLVNTHYPPHYKGQYVYRQLSNQQTYVQSKNKKKIKSLTVCQAYQVIDLLRGIVDDLFIIRNQNNTNQKWYIYKNNRQFILACFQDTYQEFLSGKKIAWCTAWLESPLITDEDCKEASILLTNELTPNFDYIWMNRKWVGKSNEWAEDGLFYWYTYQWSSCIKINHSYCIII